LADLAEVQNTRELVAHRNYILVYEIEEETVRIPRVLHSARLWPQDKA
jgi:plasmid stabilization system protein ParE